MVSWTGGEKASVHAAVPVSEASPTWDGLRIALLLSGTTSHRGVNAAALERHVLRPLEVRFAVPLSRGQSPRRSGLRHSGASVRTALQPLMVADDDSRQPVLVFSMARVLIDVQATAA